MTYRKVRSEKLSETVASQLETYILEGILPAGERLPAERELALRLDVSRPSLRDALQKLEAQGLLETKPGGGTVVKDFLAPIMTDPLTAVFNSNPETVTDFIEFRSIVEGNTAYYASLRATDADREMLKVCMDTMEAAHAQEDADLEAVIDAEFHLTIAEAAHNVVLFHVMHSLVEVLKKGVFHNRNQLFVQRGARELLLEQHRAIYDAIVGGQPEQARQAVRSHLKYIQDALREREKEEQRIEVSTQRLERFMERQEKLRTLGKKNKKA